MGIHLNIPENGRVFHVFSLKGHNCHYTLACFKRNSTNKRRSFIIIKAKLKLKVVSDTFTTPEFSNAEKVEIYP